MIKETKFEQFGFPRTEADIQGITFHETNNYELNAQELHDWIGNVSKQTNGCHYICDDTQTVQVMPDDWAVYHTGKAKDWGNRHTIAIEICSSLNDEKYLKAEDRAIELAKSLMDKYYIDMVFFHSDFDSKRHCPNRILNEYENAQNFVKRRF